MRNKRFLLVLLALVFLMAIGCKEEDKTTYYYEAYRITMNQYNSFSNSVSSGLDYTFDQVKGFRQTLRGYGGMFIESDAGISEDELKKFANQHGIGGKEYTQAKESLDKVGNLIAFFGYEPDPNNYVVWFYVEKE